MTGRILPPHESIEVKGLEELRSYLSGRVVGQDKAVGSLVRGFNLLLADLLPSWRPIGVFFFPGPTGVGKTEMALALADYLYEKEIAAGDTSYSTPPLVQVDSTLFGDSLHYAVTALMGSAPGYVGSRHIDRQGQEEGTKPILARDNFPKDRIMVLLFDEIEKAISSDSGMRYGNELQNILITLLDRAKILTNWDLASGEENPTPTDFTQTVVIFTSNIGAREIEEQSERRPVNEVLSPPDILGNILSRSDNLRLSKQKHLDEETIRKLNENVYEFLMGVSRRTFSPEFRNRWDRLVAFHFLGKKEFRRVLFQNVLPALKTTIGGKHGVRLEFSDPLIDWVVDHGVEREAGVRSLQRFVLRKITHPLATYLNADLIREGMVVRVGIGKDRVEKEGDQADAEFEIIEGD